MDDLWAELESLIGGLPPEMVRLALEKGLSTLPEDARAALAPLLDADAERLLGAALALPPDSAGEVGRLLFEFAAQAASESEPEPEFPVEATAAPSVPEVTEPTFEEELSTLIRGLPAEVLHMAVQRALPRVTDEAAAALLPFTTGPLDPERLLEAVLALPVDRGDEIGGILLDAAAQFAAEDDDEAPSRPRPLRRRRRVPFVVEAGTTFAIPASGKRRARTVTVMRRLDEGGGGIVWLGHDDAGAPIIVKTGKVAGEVPLSLRVERAVLEPLDHPNLVRLLGSLTDPKGNLYLFLELLLPNPVLRLNEPRIRERITLRAQAPGARYLAPPPSTALELVHDLLRGLEALHAVGLVHNDVKLSNFLLALDHRAPEIADRGYFQALERGEYHGVLIDAGGIRNLETLEEINHGVADPALPPIELTPIYAPPEALLGRLGDPDERPYYSTAVDVYAAALVAYTTITGFTPYSHLKAQPTDLASIVEIKRAERRGALSPIAPERLREARFQDSRFADLQGLGHERCRQRFEGALDAVLKKRLDPDPEARGSMADMRRDLERAFDIRARSHAEFTSARRIGERGPRLYAQNTFSVSLGDPYARLVQAAGGPPTGRFERPR